MGLRDQRLFRNCVCFGRVAEVGLGTRVEVSEKGRSEGLKAVDRRTLRSSLGQSG